MLIIGLAGTTLSAEDRTRLAAPQVSGVILFTRNFEGVDQITSLIDDIRVERPDPFLLCVDQEGGPVQRFQDGFARLPALARIGALHAQDPTAAIARAEEHAWLMASELRAVGVDLSFAPVVDLARGNRAIGERAFDSEPQFVSDLAQAYIRGMHLAGMAATVKHFPGHGSVVEDTHFDTAVDDRSLEEIRASDLIPFVDAIAVGAEAVMMAHVTYPAIDARAAGYSSTWIEDILRGQLGFRGVVFSDDIGMAAAEGIGDIRQRIDAHLAAGCDLVLACSPSVVDQAIAASSQCTPCDAERLSALQGAAAATWDSLIRNPQHDQFIAQLAALDAIPEGTA